MLNLPRDMHDAIASALAAVPTARWLHEAQALSERYRADRHGGEAALATGAGQVLGYAALIMPATYAQLHGAFAATAARAPSWSPQTMLDIGSGPGTALWAAANQWPTLRTLTAWEREAAFVSLGRDLTRASASAALRGARWERVDLHSVAHVATQRYDLVVIGHVLNELDETTRKATIELAWRLTEGMLVIVEPGHEAGFAVVRAARDQLLPTGAQTIAHCAHDRPCPLERDWCHFPQRLVRPEFQRRARGAPSEWEESKFSYAALARFAPEAPIWGRTIVASTSNKAYAETKISSRDGVHRYRALKRTKDAYRAVKDCDWGETFDTPLEPPIERVD